MAKRRDRSLGRDVRPFGGRWEELSPAFAALLIIGVYFFFNSCYFNCLDFCPAPFRGCTPVVLREYLGPYCLPASAQLSATAGERAALWPGRFTWVFATAVNFLATVASYFYCLYLIGRARPAAAPPGRGAVGRYVLAGCALIAVLFGVALTTESAWFMPQLEDLLGCAAAFDLPDAVSITYFTLLVGTAATALFVAASCVVVSGVRGEQSPLAVAERMRTLRTLLYVAAAALVTTVLRLSMTFSWVLAGLPSGGAAGRAQASKFVEGFASSFTAVQACAYSLILAAAYIPAALVLSRRARELAGVVGYETLPQRDEWLKAQGLADSFAEHLPRVAAILGPLLAGPLGGLLGRLAGGK